MLWLPALVPILAGLIMFATAHDRRAWLFPASMLALVATLALAAWAVTSNWTGQFVWSDVLVLRAGLSPVSRVMVVLVPAVALPVTAYACWHEAATGLRRLIALLLCFAGAMELLVIADDLVTLLIGWELVGACSWALIAHDWRDFANARSATYAFLMTRFGDLGMFVAAMAAFAGAHSFAFADLDQMHGPMLEVLVAGLLLSAAAKSGQVPFSPWLFRAMAGPTSVSALLHAATMVAAGAYLMARLYPVLDKVSWFAPAMIGVGMATALAGSGVAIMQPHAKKLLAASTSAHFGLMFAAVGAGYPFVALAHLVAHAFFKAQLFLATGVAGQRAGSYRLADMASHPTMPWLALTSLVGVLALAGVPPLGAGWTKEAIVAALGGIGPAWAMAIMLVGAGSAAYAARLQLLAFSVHGPARGDNAARSWVWLAMGWLALASLMLSALWLPSVQRFVAASLGARWPESHVWELAGSLLLIAAGAAGGVLLARRMPRLGEDGVAAGIADWLGLPAWITRLVVNPVEQIARVLDRTDHAIDRWSVRGVAIATESVAEFGRRFGEAVTDGWVQGVAKVVGQGGAGIRCLQTGLSHQYYVLLATGAGVLAAILVWGW